MPAARTRIAEIENYFDQIHGCDRWQNLRGRRWRRYDYAIPPDRRRERQELKELHEKHDESRASFFGNDEDTNAFATPRASIIPVQQILGNLTQPPPFFPERLQRFVRLLRQSRRFLPALFEAEEGGVGGLVRRFIFAGTLT